MTRIFTLAAAASMIGGAAFAEAHMTEEMTMLSGKVSSALEDCNIEADEDMQMELTMAQVAGITITASSEDEGDKCEKIKSIVEGGMSN